MGWREGAERAVEERAKRQQRMKKWKRKKQKQPSKWPQVLPALRLKRRSESLALK